MTKPNAAFVRMFTDRMPDGVRRYYNRVEGYWALEGGAYTTWTMSEWDGTFGASKLAKETEKEWVDTEGRHWEFFGYIIPLYDPGTKT